MANRVTTPRRKPPSKGGRPLGLDAEKAQQIISAARAGNSPHTQAAWAGISYETLRRWVRLGEAAVNKPEAERTANEKRLALFWQEYSRATVELTVAASASIRTLATLPIRVRAEDGTETLVSPEQQRVILKAAETHIRFRDSTVVAATNRLEVSGRDGGPVEIQSEADGVWARLRQIVEAQDKEQSE